MGDPDDAAWSRLATRTGALQLPTSSMALGYNGGPGGISRMRTPVTMLAIFVTAAVLSSPAQAQSTHAAPQAAIDAALQEHVPGAAADREMVLRLLERADVRDVAGQIGLDLRRAASAVATLEGEELAQLAAEARQVERTLAGGQSRVVISTTMIIIGLLVLILIIVAVD
jgi:hypothetical protein